MVKKCDYCVKPNDGEFCSLTSNGCMAALDEKENFVNYDYDKAGYCPAKGLPSQYANSVREANFANWFKEATESRIARFERVGFKPDAKTALKECIKSLEQNSTEKKE